MREIPNIEFKSQKKAKDIEFINLSEFFSGLDKVTGHNPKKPHRLNFYAILIVTAGEGAHQVDLKTYPLQKGSVIKISKGQVHAFQGNLKYEGYLVVFTEEFILQHFSKSAMALISHLYNYHISEPLIKNSEYNTFFINQFLDELANKTPYAKNDILAKILELYLLRLEQYSYSHSFKNYNVSYHSLFFRFKTQVEKKYVNTRNVKDYAALLSISTKHLNHITRAVALNTAKAFIDQYVILEIKRAIISTSSSLKEVAYQTGFDEVTNFTKFFKKHTGVSPKEYKSAL